jgi:Ras family
MCMILLCCCSLVGTKLDVVTDDPSKRQVPTSAAIVLAERHGLDFIEVSALTGANVEIACRRVVLSVAKLLPDVQMHLEIAGLPEGWLKSFNLITHSPLEEERRKKSGSIESVASGGSSGSPNISMMPVGSGKSRVNTSGDLAHMNEHAVYTNYWTGEETSEAPTGPAPTGLVFQMTKKRIQEGVTFRETASP